MHLLLHCLSLPLPSPGIACLRAGGLAAAATLGAGGTCTGAAAALLLRVAPLSNGGQALLAPQQLGAQQAAALGGSRCRLLCLLLSLRQGKSMTTSTTRLHLARIASSFLGKPSALVVNVPQRLSAGLTLACALILRVPNGARLGGGAGASSSSSSCRNRNRGHRDAQQLACSLSNHPAHQQAGLRSALPLQTAICRHSWPPGTLTSSSTMRRKTNRVPSWSSRSSGGMARATLQWAAQSGTARERRDHVLATAWTCRAVLIKPGLPEWWVGATCGCTQCQYGCSATNGL